MSRRSSSSDTSSRSSSSRQKKKRERDRDRSSPSRMRRSRGREEVEDSRRSSSRKKSRRRSRSDSREKKHRRSRQQRSHSRERRRRSRSRERPRSRRRSRSSDTPTPPPPPPPPTVMTKEQSEEDVVSKLRREKAIRTIESGGFNPATFTSSASEKLARIALPGERGSGPADGFAFGTSAEMAADNDTADKKEKVLAEISKEGLCHPDLFGEEKEREARWIQSLFLTRQRLMLNKS